MNTIINFLLSVLIFLAAGALFVVLCLVAFRLHQMGQNDIYGKMEKKRKLREKIRREIYGTDGDGDGDAENVPSEGKDA